jgi:hypothetical protein
MCGPNSLLVLLFFIMHSTFLAQPDCKNIYYTKKKNWIEELGIGSAESARDSDWKEVIRLLSIYIHERC